MKRNICFLIACLVIAMTVSPIALAANWGKAESVPMYDYKDEVIALLHINSANSYEITDHTNQIIIERSSENGFPYEYGKKYYFAGPLEYYVKDGNDFVHILGGEVVPTDIVKQKMEAFSEKTIEMLDVIERQPSGNYSPNATVGPVTVSGTLKTYNGKGTQLCGSYAAAIMLVYYREHGYPKLVSDAHYNNTASFINYLTLHIEADQAGSTIRMLVNGIDWYFDQKGSVLIAEGKTNYSYNEYKEKINNNQPVILGDNSGSAGHWVVGYGYKYNQIIVVYNKFAIVNDGYGHNGVELNWSYVHDAVYFRSLA